MLGKKIKDYIQETGISQKNLAIMAKMSLDKLNLSLNDHRQFKFEEYEVICYVLNVGVDKFLEPKKPKNRRG